MAARGEEKGIEPRIIHRSGRLEFLLDGGGLCRLTRGAQGVRQCPKIFGQRVFFRSRAQNRHGIGRLIFGEKNAAPHEKRRGVIRDVFGRQLCRALGRDQVAGL